MAHRAPWTEQDEATLYRCIAAGLMQDQIAERLGRTKRAIRWKVGIDRASAAVVANNQKGCEALSTPRSQAAAGDQGTIAELYCA